MARPKPIELLIKFFPELQDKTLPKANQEASKEINVRICEAIMSDLITKFDSLRSSMGDGALILKLIDDKSEVESQNYVNKYALEQDLVEANARQDETVVDFVSDALKKIDKANFEDEICLILIDNSGASVALLPREDPAQRITEMMEGL